MSELPRPRVFVVQAPRRSREGGGTEPAFDITPAAAWGDLVYVFPSPAQLGFRPNEDLQRSADHAREALRQHAMDGRDHLLCVGNAVLVAVVASVVTERLGCLPVLQWDGDRGEYRSALVQPQAEAGV